MRAINVLYVPLPISFQRVIKQITRRARSFCSPSCPGLQGGCLKKSPAKKMFAAAPLSTQRVAANSIRLRGRAMTCLNGLTSLNVMPPPFRLAPSYRIKNPVPPKTSLHIWHRSSTYMYSTHMALVQHMHG